MATKLQELTEQIAAKNKALAGVLAEAGPERDMSKITSIEGDSRQKVAEIQRRHKEITVLAEARDELKQILAIDEQIKTRRAEYEDPAGGPEFEGGPGRNTLNAKAHDRRTVGELFTDSRAYKGWQRGMGVGPLATLKADLKTLFQTSAGWAPETTRTGLVVPIATRPLAVADIVPQTETTQNAVVYMEETTFTNAAAEAAEAGTYAESALALTEQTSNVRKIATFLPATDEQLADVPQAMGYINNRLPFMLRQRLDSQILVGNGTSPNLRGVLNVVGIQTQAKGADPTPDAVYKAMVLVMANAFADPDTAIFHPLDWQDIRLLRTADGIYIWGSPSEPGPDRIWGLPVVKTTAITQNTGLVGAFQAFSELSVRQDVDIQISNSHSTYFIEGKQAVRADIRVAFIVYRPAAFASITGI